jgi:hypothetical protein
MTIGMFMFFGNAFATDPGRGSSTPPVARSGASIKTDINGNAYFYIVTDHCGEGPFFYRYNLSALAKKGSETWALELLDEGTNVFSVTDNHTVLYWARERNLEKLLERLEKDGYIPELEEFEEQWRRDNMRIEIPMYWNYRLLSKCIEFCKQEPLRIEEPFARRVTRNLCFDKCKDRFAEGNQVEFNIIEGVRYGTDFVVNQLIENGANLDIVDETGRSALTYAIYNEDMKRKLEDAGAHFVLPAPVLDN